MVGKLVLVVGPSGVGKDTLLDPARKRLSDQAGYFFPRRFITRPKNAGGEDHIALSPEDFELAEAEERFALSWRAHDLAYGVPYCIVSEIAKGSTVIVNVSRGIIDQTRKRFSNVLIACITASEEILKQRLRERGRESEAEIEKRLCQASAYRLIGDHIHLIDNSGPLDASVARFLDVIGAQPKG